MSRWIVRSWRFKGRACIEKAHQEGKVNREDRIIKVHTQIILITLFRTILCSSKDLGGTRIRRILHHITPVSNKTRNNSPTRMQDSRRISRHSNRTIKLHDQPHHLQIRFWVRSLSWWSKWTGWTCAWTRYRTLSRRTSLPRLIIRRVSKFLFLTNYHRRPLSTHV